MPSIRRITAMIAGAIVAAAACKGGGGSNEQAAGPGTADTAAIKAGDRIPAGGVLPPPNALSAPRPAKLNPDAGAALFGSMNCDGCHGGGAIGWVGPSLVDGPLALRRSDEAIFRQFSGRPKGMPAYGGSLGTGRVDAGVVHQARPFHPSADHLLATGGNATATPPTCASFGAGGLPSGRAEAGDRVGEPGEMPAKYGCTACHAVDHKVVGPAFKDVAAK
jgi:cytochrome c551/c552